LLEFTVAFAVMVRDFGQSFGWIRRADVHIGNFGGGGRNRGSGTCAKFAGSTLRCVGWLTDRP